MAANTKVDAATKIDRIGDAMIPVINYMTDPLWRCEFCEDGPGPAGECRIYIPAASSTPISQIKRTLALNEAGLHGQMQHDFPIQILRQSYDSAGVQTQELIWQGKVTDVEADISNDGLIVYGMDARVELQNVRVVGRWIIVANDSGGPYFQEGWPAHFNPGGRPNCIFYGGEPFFSPYPDYGLNDGDILPLTPEQSESLGKSTYWPLSYIMRYFRNFYSYEQTTFKTYPSQFSWIKRAPSWLVWPVGFGDGLDDESVANFNQGVGQNNSARGNFRKGRDLNMDGVYLFGRPDAPGGMDELFRSSGLWTWDLKMGGQAAPETSNVLVQNILTAYPSRYVGNGIKLPYAAGGGAASTLGQPCITGGNYRESSRAVATRVVSEAALVKIETRVSTTSSQIQYAHTAARLLLWQKQVWTNHLAGDTDEESISKANADYPEVFTLELNSSYNFQTGTDVSAFSRAPIPRPIWPHLLTFLGATSGPRDSILFPYPVKVEVDTTGGGVWVLAGEFDGFEIWDNGRFFFGNMRSFVAASATRGFWKLTTGSTLSDTGATSGAVNITVLNVRCTIVIPCDHRLTHLVFTSNDAGFAADSYSEMITDNPDDARLATGMTRIHYMTLGSLYELWFRSGSWPQPQSISGSTQYSDKLTLVTALRNDQPMQKSHTRRAAKQMSRLTRSGALRVDGWIYSGWAPGQQVDSFEPVNGQAGVVGYNGRFVIGRRRYEIVEATDSNGSKIFHAATILTPM